MPTGYADIIAWPETMHPTLRAFKDLYDAVKDNPYVKQNAELREAMRAAEARLRREGVEL